MKFAKDDPLNRLEQSLLDQMQGPFCEILKAELVARAILSEYFFRPFEVSVLSAKSAVAEDLQLFYADVRQLMEKWIDDPTPLYKGEESLWEIALKRRQPTDQEPELHKQPKERVQKSLMRYVHSDHFADHKAAVIFMLKEALKLGLQKFIDHAHEHLKGTKYGDGWVTELSAEERVRLSGAAPSNDVCESRMGLACEMQKRCPNIRSLARSAKMKYGMNRTKLWYRQLNEELQPGYVRAVVRAAAERAKNVGNREKEDLFYARKADEERAPEMAARKDRFDRKEKKQAAAVESLTGLDLLVEPSWLDAQKSDVIEAYLRALQFVKTKTRDYAPSRKKDGEKRTQTTGTRAALLQNLKEILREIGEEATVPRCSNDPPTTGGRWCEPCKAVHPKSDPPALAAPAVPDTNVDEAARKESTDAAKPGKGKRSQAVAVGDVDAWAEQRQAKRKSNKPSHLKDYE